MISMIILQPLSSNSPCKSLYHFEIKKTNQKNPLSLKTSLHKKLHISTDALVCHHLPHGDRTYEVKLVKAGYVHRQVYFLLL